MIVVFLQKLKKNIHLFKSGKNKIISSENRIKLLTVFVKFIRSLYGNNQTSCNKLFF